jgi:hypothetical protein
VNSLVISKVQTDLLKSHAMLKVDAEEKVLDPEKMGEEKGKKKEKMLYKM